MKFHDTTSTPERTVRTSRASALRASSIGGGPVPMHPTLRPGREQTAPALDILYLLAGILLAPLGFWIWIVDGRSLERL